jgi:hypothetical protein
MQGTPTLTFKIVLAVNKIKYDLTNVVRKKSKKVSKMQNFTLISKPLKIL